VADAEHFRDERLVPADPGMRHEYVQHNKYSERNDSGEYLHVHDCGRRLERRGIEQCKRYEYWPNGFVNRNGTAQNSLRYWAIGEFSN